jgi:23S rRNA-/tRNA-specific pseudouridylate synthase
VVERLPGGQALLAVTTHTGRMHQVRAHLGHAELPIVGDELYGGPACEGLVGHFLHAASLTGPLDPDASVTITAALPLDRQEVLARLGSKSNVYS